MARLSFFSLALALLPALASAQTVYYPKNQVMFGPNSPSGSATVSATAAAATFTGAAAYDQTTLNAPGPPQNFNSQFLLQLFSGSMTNISIPLPSNFMGFSIEMSVFNQYLGKNSSIINVPFLNLLANVAQRTGSVQIRVGGNSQETAELVDTIPNGNGSILSKDLNNIFNHNTPPIEYTADLFYMMNNISQLVNVYWYMGIPFFNITPYDLNLAEASERILGDRLLALQAGNEPDLYAVNGRNHRNEGYSPADYKNDINGLIQQASGDVNLARKNDLWLVPSVSSVIGNTAFNPDAVWATNIVTDFLQQLHALTVERYPNNNCAALFNTGAPVVNPQDVLVDYLDHTKTYAVQQEYISSAAIAVQNSKPLIMFETNTASCSGFVGISDAFVGALWGVDWALTLAAGNFSSVLFHFGGQSAFYNPFTPPPGNQSHFRQWTVGPIYYSTLVVAEAMGKNNASQVVDLFANGFNGLTPAWAIYENGTPKKVVIINYANDPTGASTITATIAIGGGQTGQTAANPSSVRVKRLSASAVTQKNNITWAGQTFGNAFESDGRMMGQMTADTVQCDANNGCPIQVPAPGLALVFLTDDAFNAENLDPSQTLTFATSSTPGVKTINTAVIDPSVLATSNGHGNVNALKFTTSPGSRESSALRAVMPGFLAFVAAAAGTVLFARRW